MGLMMNLFSRLAIGTANWQKPYNGARVTDDDQQRILDYAMSAGIDLIDTATAYEWDWTKINSYFKVVVRVNEKDNWADIMEKCKDKQPYCLMAHSLSYYKTLLRDYKWCNRLGVSLYEPGTHVQVYGGSVIQVPYSLFDRRFESIFLYDEPVHEIHVRSIFLRGRILEKTTPQECIKFCLCNPNIDRVIIGADSYEQFRDNLHFLHEWNRMEKHDLKLLDPRQWEEK